MLQSFTEPLELAKKSEMNETARMAGAICSHFENPSGLPDKNHYVTASDMAKITAYALENPAFLKVVSTKNADISNGANVLSISHTR